MRIAILGAGNVGGVLGRGWAKAGHDVHYGVPDPADAKHRETLKATRGGRIGTVAEAARGAEAVVLAVPFGAVADVITACGEIDGKIVIDATNPLRMGTAGLELAVGFNGSGGEQVSALAKGAAVFKTMNQIGFEAMADPSGFAVKPVMFVAGDDAAKKPTVMQLVQDLGFEAVDAGGIVQARLLEPFAMLWIHMALNRKVGRNRAFAYVARDR